MAIIPSNSSPGIFDLQTGDGQLGILSNSGDEIIYSSVTPRARALINNDNILSPDKFSLNSIINGILSPPAYDRIDTLTFPEARMKEINTGMINEYVKEFQTGLTNYPYLQIFVVVTNQSRLLRNDKIDSSTTKNIGGILGDGAKVIEEGVKTVNDVKNNIVGGIDSLVNSGINNLAQLVDLNSFGGSIINLGKVSATTTLKGFNYVEKANNFQDAPSNSNINDTFLKSIVGDLTRQESRLLDSFALPMPTDHTVNDTLKWNGVNAGTLRGIVLDSETQSAIGNKLSDNSNFTSELVGKIIGRAVLGASSKIIGGDSDMTDQQFVNKATGTITNPRPTQTFDGTELRNFKFSWLLNPRNPKEAKGIIQLLEKLRYYAHSEFTDETKTFIRFPAEFELEFKNPDGTVNKNIPRIKRCVLNSIDIKYNEGNGRWTTFLPSNIADDGMPTHIRLSLSFSETTIITKQDIEEGF